MENKMRDVKRWLKTLPRKPFTDLNVNHPNVARSKTQNRVVKSRKPKRNKSHLKILDSEDKSKLPIKKYSKTKIKSVAMKTEQNHEKVKCEKNESGIFIDDDIEIITDTPSVDKDQEAWLAVLRVEQQGPCKDSPSKLSKSEFENDFIKNPVEESVQCENVAAGKVQFYRKSSLLPIKNLNGITLNNKIIKYPEKLQTFTIDSSSYITTVEFYEDQDDYNTRSKFSAMSDIAGCDNFSKNSVGVQTENKHNFSNIDETTLSVNNSNFKENNHITTLSKNHDAESANLAPVSAKAISAIETNQNEAPQAGQEYAGLVIDDSDSDNEISLTGGESLIEVTAEVHRSETEK